MADATSVAALLLGAGSLPDSTTSSVAFTAGQSLAKWADVLISARRHLISPCVAKVYKQLCCVEHMGACSLHVLEVIKALICTFYRLNFFCSVIRKKLIFLLPENCSG